MFVEVFKTNVTLKHEAGTLLEQMQHLLTGCQASFDLEDCDKVLRVVCTEKEVHSRKVIELLQAQGFRAEILED